MRYILRPNTFLCSLLLGSFPTEVDTAREKNECFQIVYTALIVSPVHWGDCLEEIVDKLRNFHWFLAGTRKFHFP